MTATTNPRFDDATEALEVAKAFSDSIQGKTILVTGVNRKGVGYTTAEAFASQSAKQLIIAGRSLARINECIDDLRQQWPEVDYRPLEVDLSSQEAVRAAAKEVLDWDDVPYINILVNNAGIMSIPTRTLNIDGIESHFGTNHIGHFLFTNLIMPKLLAAAKTAQKGATRIVNVSSSAAELGGIRWSDLNFDKKSTEIPEEERPNYAVLKAWGVPDPENRSYMHTAAYVQSKAANVLFGIGLTKRLYETHGVLSIGVHPGVIMTELARYAPPEDVAFIVKSIESGAIPVRSQAAGASTSLVAATDPRLGPSETRDGKEGWGAYLKDCQISADAHPGALSSKDAERLWALSEELVKEKFPW